MIPPPGLCQVRATWREGGVPESVGKYSTVAVRAADNAAQTAEAAPEFEVRAFAPGERDEETAAALAAWRDDGILMRVDPAGVEFGSDPIPLVVGHDAGRVIADDLEIAQSGRQFSAVGWVPSERAEELSRFLFVSPRLAIVRAHIVDMAGIRFAEATHTVLVEVSVTSDPARDGTTFAVAPAGKTLWPRPTGERFTRIHPPDEVFRVAFDSAVEAF